ncbi:MULTISPECIES: hypothetical protein [Pectobacteriaceae]|uniref:ParE family toxin-like protein n=1 Tax=Pectobacteriaceae TaxID=1903410 RepID=UPI0006ACF7FA|nr:MULTISPECIES: hypothetical protein [Pectobacteriaceae]
MEMTFDVMPRGLPVPPCTQNKATGLLERFYTGERGFCKRLPERGYLKIDIGPFWRLLSKDGGRKWYLLQHATYNREINK